MLLSNFLASLCSLGDWHESRFVRNPEDRFCRDEAKSCTYRCSDSKMLAFCSYLFITRSGPNTTVSLLYFGMKSKISIIKSDLTSLYTCNSHQIHLHRLTATKVKKKAKIRNICKQVPHLNRRAVSHQDDCKTRKA